MTEGVNPVIAQCFWCAKAKNDYELRGVQVRGQTPRLTVFHYGPCAACHARMSLGLTCVEIEQPKEGGAPPLATYPAPVSPTGRWVVVQSDQVKHLALPAASLDRLKGRDRALFEVTLFERLFGAFYQEGSSGNENADGEVVRGEGRGSRPAEGFLDRLPETPESTQ